MTDLNRQQLCAALGISESTVRRRELDGERKFGQFLYLEDGLPAAERVLVEINA